MSRSVRALGPLVVFALVAVLAGCAAPTTTPTPHHSSGPTQSPEPKAAATPGNRVPLDCADLFTPASVQSLVNAPVTVQSDETTPPETLNDVASSQRGTLTCIWSGEEGSESGPFAQVAVVIAPDSAAAFHANYPLFLSGGPALHSAPVENTAGDQSWYECTTTDDGDDAHLCYTQMLVGSYWVSGDLSAVAPATESMAGTNTAAVLARVAAKLRAAGEPKATAWVGPDTTPPAFCTDPASTATVRAIFGEPSLTALSGGTPSVDASNVGAVGPDRTCDWSSPSAAAVDIELLAGGSWALPTLKPSQPSDSVDQAPFVRTTLPGVGAVLESCDVKGCDTYLAVGTTAVEVSFGPHPESQRATILSSLAKAIAAT